jgi:purine-cytosine permease-like protein
MTIFALGRGTGHPAGLSFWWAIVAIVVGTLAGGLVWHSTHPGPVPLPR